MQDHSEQLNYRSRGGTAAAFAAWSLALGAVAVLCLQLRDALINVVNYEIQPLRISDSAVSILVPLLAVTVAVSLIVAARCGWIRGRDEQDGQALSEGCFLPAGRAALPLTLPVAVFVYSLIDGRDYPPFALICVAFLGVCWSIGRLGMGVRPLTWNGAERGAPLLLGAAILCATLWHTVTQVHFWQHFLLGYADFGFFTTELEHCLPWKDVGSVRFSDTRMGYHCVPMFYTLAPFYALARSPVFLMVIGPLALHMAAVPFYQLARDRSGSALIGLLVGLAWLALPSITRLPYSNSYGFQSIYLAVPWLAWCFSLAFRGRWKASHFCLAAALFCEETVCGVALGWGLFLMIFGGRPRAGLVIAALAISYLLLCTLWIIPHFAASAEYTRLTLFGAMTPGVTLDRISRPRVLWYVMALAVPLAPWFSRPWRLLIVAVPTLILVIQMQQNDYLNIKYWHQSSILPVLFAAAVLGITRGAERTDTPGRRACSIGPPLALLVSVLLFHHWMAISPWSQAQRVYAADPRLQAPDPRLAAVDFVRSRFAPESASVVATERMAAHFIDYRMVYPAPTVRLIDTALSQTLLILDRSDAWDKLVMEGILDSFVTEAIDAGFRMVHVEGPVLVLARDESPNI